MTGTSALLHEAVPPLIRKWEAKLGVKVSRLLPPAHEDEVGELQPPGGNIRLNTELVKKPKDLLEYVVVHEMLHLIDQPTASASWRCWTSTTRLGARPVRN
jgi:predicted metal-dependent hydrolase